MKSTTIRLLVLLAAISILGITVTQVFWTKKAFDLRERQLNFNVHIALREVASQILAANSNPAPVGNPVTQHAANYYTVMVNDTINLPLLEELLRHEFRKRNIHTNFEYGIYDCQHQQMVFGSSLNVDEATPDGAPQINKLPHLRRDNYYFAVYFPELDTTLLSEMRNWWFSGAVLLLVIGFFAYAMFVILKQKRLSEVQTDFINNMTHEFKTPISTIAISAEVLRNPNIVKAPERLLSYATIIQNEAHRLQAQIERVLQIATSNSGTVKLNRENADVHALVHRAVQNLEPALAAKNGRITYQLQATQTCVTADVLHLTNMIYNLLDNAIKYTTREPQITIATRTEKQQLVLSITDNGIGLSEKAQQRVFDKFYRVHTGNLHDVKGFGLGLHYVHYMAKAHNGSVSVKSKPGQGSTFILRLPLCKEQ